MNRIVFVLLFVFVSGIAWAQTEAASKNIPSTVQPKRENLEKGWESPVPQEEARCLDRYPVIPSLAGK